MLIMDVFKGHLTPEIEATITGSSMNRDLVIIPGGMILHLQVLDVVVNKPFKDHLKQLYSEWLLKQDHAFSPAGRIKKPSVTILCQHGSVSHQKLTVKCFKKCCLFNAVGGTEDMLQNGSEEDGDVRSKCEEDEEYGDSHTDW